MTWIVAEDPYEVKVVRNVDIGVVWHLYEDGEFKLVSSTDPDGNEVELSDKEVEDAENKAIDEYWDCMKDKNDG